MYQVLTSENDTNTSESVYIFGRVSPGMGSLSHHGRHTLLGLFQQHRLGDDCLFKLIPSEPCSVLGVYENGPDVCSEVRYSAGATNAGKRMDEARETIEYMSRQNDPALTAASPTADVTGSWSGLSGTSIRVFSWV